MEGSTMETIIRIRRMAMESTFGLMAELTLVNGLVANNQINESTSYPMTLSSMDSGKATEEWESGSNRLRKSSSNIVKS